MSKILATQMIGQRILFRRAVPFRPKALKKLTKREEESLSPLPIYVSVVNL
jgi:hypothetical protein